MPALLLKPVNDDIREGGPLLAAPAWFEYAFTGRSLVFVLDSTLASSDEPKGPSAFIQSDLYRECGGWPFCCLLSLST
jgi:hypothetical protein